jgi:predicted nucleotidyltransferase
MAAPRARAKKIIERFIKHLEKQIKVQQVYLFGSHARGSEKRHSDIDIAVVSENFKKMAPFDRLVYLGKMAWEAGTPVIEAIGYTPKEFATKSLLEFPSEIKQNGIRILPAA